MGINKRKLYGTILGGIAFLAVIIAVTYARYVWKSDDECLSIIIHEDNTYKGRPELDFIIKTKNSNYPN